MTGGEKERFRPGQKVIARTFTPDRFSSVCGKAWPGQCPESRRLRQAVGPFDDFTHMRLLKLFQRNQRADLWQIFHCGNRGRSLAAQFGGKILRAKFVAFGQDDGALDGVAQLAKIARPGNTRGCTRPPRAKGLRACAHTVPRKTFHSAGQSGSDPRRATTTAASPP